MTTKPKEKPNVKFTGTLQCHDCGYKMKAKYINWADYFPMDAFPIGEGNRGYWYQVDRPQHKFHCFRCQEQISVYCYRTYKYGDPEKEAKSPIKIRAYRW